MSAQDPPTAAHPGYRSGRSLWLFRHGEVHEDYRGKAYGGLDVPLSASGERDTREVIERFSAIRPREIACSPLQRARVLGEGLAAATGAALRIEPGLAEIQRGRWQGLPVAELFERHADEVSGFYADPWNFDAHGGETDRDVLQRAWPALERLFDTAAAEPGECVFLAAHYNVLRVLIAHAVGIAPPHSFRLRIDLSGICRLHDGPHGFVLQRSNVRSPS